MKWWMMITFHIVTVILAGWTFATFYEVAQQLAEVIRLQPDHWEVTINGVPCMLFLLYAVVISFVLTRMKRQMGVSLKAILLLPPEFYETDEREQKITTAACRAAYLSMYIAIPFLVVLLFIYPFVETIIPAYPIFIVLSLSVVQILSYGFVWRKKYVV
ncbi:hypothetical protein [Shouchella lonarensis]|uniref:DUF2178 domain-containing protein n=1 Tax=Shouchella lonarensis TaxID=1464122 RepID=A0A1G6MSC7_9BACI|nr:hypothetical protein [Shouchella lonarensis]SDC57865.1 hypothetical protein SAMN05421737_110112 [Shouchella lonarensis]